MPPRTGLVPVVFLALLAATLASAEDVTQDLGAQFPGFRAEPHGWWVGSVEKEGRLYVYAALIVGPGASGTVCRPMAEKALAALGVLPAR